MHRVAFDKFVCEFGEQFTVRFSKHPCSVPFRRQKAAKRFSAVRVTVRKLSFKAPKM